MADNLLIDIHCIESGLAGDVVEIVEDTEDEGERVDIGEEVFRVIEVGELQVDVGIGSTSIWTQVRNHEGV